MSTKVPEHISIDRIRCQTDMCIFSMRMFVVNVDVFEYVCRSMRVSLLARHHCYKLFVVHLAITVDIGFSDHLIDLLVGELLSQIGHDVTQLGRRNETVAVFVEHTECLADLFFRVGVLHLSGHHRQELWEIDSSVAVSVDLIDHILQFGLGGVLAQRAHDCAELLGGDGSIAVLVEQAERLLELGDLFLGELVSHFCGSGGASFFVVALERC